MTGTSLVHDLTVELSAAGSGVGYIARALDRLVDALDLREAIAVLDDDVLGPQLFTAGRRPLALDVAPSGLLARGVGIHTDPMVPDHAADLSTVQHLCQLALRLDRLQYESLHDPLTGLLNRRGFEAQLVQAVSRAQRYRWTFALVVLDLDDFKQVNDRLGHHGGDQVLRRVAERLRAGLRAGDVAARFGGDEFALLVHVGAGTELAPVLDRLGTPGQTGRSKDPEAARWTVGMVLCPDEGATADELLRLADERLYLAKRSRPRSRS